MAARGLYLDLIAESARSIPVLPRVDKRLAHLQPHILQHNRKLPRRLQRVSRGQFELDEGWRGGGGWEVAAAQARLDQRPETHTGYSSIAKQMCRSLDTADESAGRERERVAA